MNPPAEQRGLVNVRSLGVSAVVLFCLITVAYFFYGLQPASSELQRGEPASSAPGSGISFSAGTATTTADGGSVAAPFRILKGEGFRDIGAHLSQQSLIRSITVFKLYALLTGRAQRFQPGAYEISSAMSVLQIVDALTAGGKNDVLVTVPEGATVKDIDAILTAAGVRAGGSLATLSPRSFSLEYPFLENADSLEGFLFPDSYYFSFDATPGDVAHRMLDNFLKKAWPSLAAAGGWYDRLILASFLEREVATDADRGLVAGILLKRLRLGMPLQVDATVAYAKCGGQFRNCDAVKVSRDDLRFASPYNTYQKTGWTPTPIANPGAGAIRAALSPVASPYLYYVSARDGSKTYFSRTLDEQNAKRAQYL